MTTLTDMTETPAEVSFTSRTSRDRHALRAAAEQHDARRSR